MSTIQFKPAPELPLSSSGTFDVIAVTGNKDTVRINWNNLQSGSVQQTQSIPTEAGTAPGTQYITLAADSSGLYVSDGSEWRKTFTYGTHWEDLEPAEDGSETRALLVNKTMDLSETEVGNVRESLNIGIATVETEGLVKGYSNTSDATAEDYIPNAVRVDADGTMLVNIAVPASEANPTGIPGIVTLKNYYDADSVGDSVSAVTESYVQGAIDNYSKTVKLPIATTEQVGVVQAIEGSPIKVDAGGRISIDIATDSEQGVVYLDSDKDTSVDSHAASVGLVKEMLTGEINPIRTTIAGDDLGLVRVPGNTPITIDSAGVIGVRSAANSGAEGVVSILQELNTSVEYSNDTTGNTAVTPQAVTDYVDYRLEHLDESLPKATATTLGAIITGNGVITDEEGVLTLTNATPSTIGGVYVQLAEGDGNETTPASVPTVSRVLELLRESSGTGSVGEATQSKYGVVRLSTSIIEDGAKIGVNSAGQLMAERTSISSGTIDGEVGLAKYNELGLVALSSSSTVSNTANNPGLPIGASSTGMIYVDAKASAATTNKLGLVKLSVPSGVLNASDPGVGVDENGKLRVNLSGTSSGGATSYYMYETSKPSEPVNLYYYKDGAYNMPFVYTATSSKKGVVLLGTSTIIKGGTPVGVDDSGRLSVAINLSGGGDSTSTTIGTATSTSAGVVKLAQDELIAGGLPIGVNANGQLVVASSSTNLSSATTNIIGGVKLSSSETYQDLYGRVGLNNNNQIVVAPATYSVPGVVKVAGSTFDAGDNYSLVGRSPEGALAVKVTGGSSSPSSGTIEVSAPLTVKLVEKEDVAGYIVTMTGGFVQMNDGSLVKVDPVTVEDNVIIDPAAGQMLKLKVYINKEGEAVAKLQLTSDTKVLTCKPLLV